MTDTRLRELERRFKESGAPEDELAYLQERVRQGESLDWESYSRLAELNVEVASEYLKARVERGELEQEKLELAAYCSHEPARVALGASCAKTPEDLEDWVLGLTSWGLEPLLRVAIAAGYWAMPKVEGSEAKRRTLLAISCAEEWLNCPCDAHRKAAEHHYCPPGGYGPNEENKLADRIAKTVGNSDDQSSAARSAADAAWRAAVWHCAVVRSLFDPEVVEARRKLVLHVRTVLLPWSLSSPF